MIDIQEQMDSILANPDMMKKIMAIAQNLNNRNQADEKDAIPTDDVPNIDISMIQKLSGLASKSNIDNNQRSLLKALSPYLTRKRISKLERAMRATKMATMASVFLNQSNFNTSGR